VIFKDAETYHKLKENSELAIKGDVRYLNQTELELAQTVPRGYTNILTRDQAACLLGDGWTIDVISYLFSGLNE
jgi:hypothetical protein